MSAALVRKSLALIESEDHDRDKNQKNDSVFSQLMPENYKIKRQILKKGRKVRKVNLLQVEKKYTVIDAKKIQKSKDATLKSQHEKLKLIRDACKIELDSEVTQQLIDRAVTRRPIKRKEAQKEPQPTAFTEEDFKKFEEEYFDEDL